MALFLFLAACGFVQDEAIDGPYRLVAVDTDDDMTLCRSVGTDGTCVGDGLPEPTVFQAGANAQYIVFARHPWTSGKRPDRSVTEFYYISRKANEWDVAVRVFVSGPFTESEYLEEKRRLQLPQFSKVFARLK
ncbi:hypothetical protein IVB46_02275 [Bradyrhizobium sp. 61]|uniref:hypothetical protein n=1 Tax=unclassified Bradyrhizobium TaxID=2631580 RepID=UPI001FFA0626|nr:MULTISPECIES: hypothetical protein [unclassified Bradyrhizobium]MCK1274067.1 hypothetical protein [Bradyrhizobium sp. 61]MCK1447511.1 hypothetical protein [Bradyrhizobium sp. 48]MCK1462845.1 hypothetical protein [Bradyrhizobium sp. 2]